MTTPISWVRMHPVRIDGTVRGQYWETLPVTSLQWYNLRRHILNRDMVQWLQRWATPWRTDVYGRRYA